MAYRHGRASDVIRFIPTLKQATCMTNVDVVILNEYLLVRLYLHVDVTLKI